MIRHADPAADAAACAAIYAPNVTAGVASFEEEPPDAAEMQRRIEETSARYPWLVAERDGAVAGYAYGTVHRTRRAYRWVVEVTVYVDQARRRSGVGRGLYEVLLPLLARQRLQVAVAGITLPNDASVALHEAVGFQPVGIYRDFGFKFGAWHDVGWWQARLAP
ncbi:MAG TPA: arsinothricin resistance N-acetyltransferase ArsN1 family B, partial [Solirubrobacteraceae bacterium]|nr:arsinothricin resistance N-acetyltransferase ArsN1 family B [Solirubrobacteraceae bacterium]